MNIIKETIKLNISFPMWPLLLKKIKRCKNKKILLIGTPVHGNLGDHAIAQQSKFFFDDYFDDYSFFEILMPLYHTHKSKIQKCVNRGDIIVLSGGGWMGNLWIHNEEVIREVIKTYKNNEIVILPQTVFYTSDENGEKQLNISKKIYKEHKNLHIFLREKKSYNFMKKNFDFSGDSNIYLAPDIVLFGKNISDNNYLKHDDKVINVCIRNDCESIQDNLDYFYNELNKRFTINKISTVIKSPVTLRKRNIKLENSWDSFKKGKITITDRLHAMLFSMLNGVPCIALDNKTGKVFGVAEWLKDSNMVLKADSLKDVIDILDNNSINSVRKYDRNVLLPLFDEMAAIIRRDKNGN